MMDHPRGVVGHTVLEDHVTNCDTLSERTARRDAE
jgi:hypothetical protein